MYKFIKVKDPNNKFDVSDLEMTVDTEHMGDLVESFGEFLRGCGFYYTGTLDVVEPDEVNNEDI